MNKRTNKELLPVRIIIAVAIVAIFAASLWMYFGQETVAMQSAREAYAQFLSENPESQDKDFIYIYEDSIIIAIRNGKVVRKEYTTEVDAVKAALSSKDGANYSLSGTDNGKLFAVKLFQKTDDIYALGLSTLAVGADKLSIKVVTNGMIFATFEIPAEAIDRKESPVGIAVKKINPEDNVTLGKNETGFAYDIDVTNLVENNTSLIKVTMNGPKGLSPSMNKKAITVYHKNKAIASTYDPAKGEIYFETTDFSPYTFTYQMITVNSLADLRYYLQREASGNIMLGDNFAEADKNGNIVIDLSTMREGTATNDFYKETKGNDPYSKYDDEKVYYAKASIDGTTAYFGALVIGDMTIDLNGKTIVYKADATKDAALFAVGNNSSLTIVDSSEGKTGTIKVPYDQHALWSVDYTSAVSIYGGNFVKEAKSGTQTGRALLYSSGGKISVYAGSSFDFGTERNGGFNVLDSVGSTRIWIHNGVLLKNQEYCPITDVKDNRVVLVGGAGLSNPNDGWYTVQGQKLQVKVEHTDKMLYRVGNKNAFPLRVFFELIEGATAPDKVNIQIVDTIATDNAIKDTADKLTNKFDPANGYYGSIVDQHTTDYVYTPAGNGATWDSGTISFKNGDKYFSGPVRLELIDENKVVLTSINLEVVDGYNIYSGTTVYSPNATNGDVCLLENVDVSSSSASANAIIINGGRTLFGNGFTINDTRYVKDTSGNVTKDYTDASTKYGLIKIENGAIENVKILGYQSETVGYVLSGKHGYAPVVLIDSGTSNASIYNSYIFGGYFPVDVVSGTALLDNVTLDGGGLANMEITSADVTLRNCTTTTNTINPNKPALGILVCKSTAKIRLEGTFRQYNWLKKNQLPSQNNYNFKVVLADIYEDGNFAYGSTDDPYVNMGIVFADLAGAQDNFTSTIVNNNNMLIDNTDNKYGFTQTITLAGLSATGYLPKVESGKTYDVAIHPKHEDYAPSHYRVYKPAISFNTEANKVTESATQWFKYNTSTHEINIGLAPNTSAKSLNLSGLALTRYGYNGTYDLRYSYTDASGKTQEETVDAKNPKVDLNLTGSNHKLILRAAVSGCTPSGVRDDSVFEVYTYVMPITIVKHDYAAPVLSVNSATGSEHFWIERGSWSDDYSEALPIYNGVKVTVAYPLPDNPENKIEIDLSECLITPSKNGTTCIASFTTEYNGQLNNCSLKITVNSDGQFTFAQCKYDSNSPTKLYYHHEKDDGKGGRDKLPTSTLNLTCTYTFTDSYSQTSNSVSVKYTFGTTKDKPAYTSWSKFNTDKNAKIGEEEEDSGGGWPCVTPDTLVTLADGTQKEIQYVTYSDQLLVWNFYEGKYDVMPSSIVMNHGYRKYKVVTLNFADGTTVNTINGHGFFDANERKYVILSDNNVEDYIGHEFAKVSGDGYTTTKLVSYSVKTEYTESWSILTAEYYNCILEDMWTVTPAEVEGSPDYLMPFEVGTDMKYDAAKMQADIEKYGLYTYADFDEYVTYEQFIGFGFPSWKVAVGKGYITWEEILYLLSIHVG